MREDHAGCIHFYRFPHNFTRMHLNMAQCSRKGGYVSVPGFVVEKDHHKDLPLQIGAGFAEIRGSCRGEDRVFFLHTHVVKSPGQLGNAPQLGIFRHANALNVRKRLQLSGQQSIQ